jgi:hypothetical protein
VLSKALFLGLKNQTLIDIDLHQEDQDPTCIELKLKKWEVALEKYANAEEQVMSEIMADRSDSDEKDLEEYENASYKYKTMVIGFRRDFDAIDSQSSNDSHQSDREIDHVQNSHGLPRLAIHVPPTLQEDLDLRSFLKWRPLWDNYSDLMALSRRSRETRVGAFRQCCSPGFLKIVQHTIGIRPTLIGI